ncbi:MAG: hypothetical protein WAW61_03450, partial [Methylococcaceae bacterium]
MNKLDVALQRQIDLNKSKNMLYTHLDQTIEVDPGFLAVLEELCSKDGENFPETTLQNAVSFASQVLLKRL